MPKAMASSKVRHLRIKIPDITDRIIDYKYAPIYGKSKALCEAVGRTKFIYPPKFANYVSNFGRSHFEHRVTCKECIKELVERKLIPDKEVSQFEKRCQADRDKIMINVLKNITKFMINDSMWLTGRKTADKIGGKNQ